MPSTYTTRIKAERPATGEQSGIWGTTANQAIFDMFDEAVYSLGSVAILDIDTTLTVPDGLTSPNRAFVIRFTGSLTANRTITLPNIARRFEVENGTTGGFSLLVKTPSSGTVTVVNGETAVIYANGSSITKKFSTSSDPTKVDKAGDIMSGNLEIQKANPSLILDKTAATQEASVVGHQSGTLRWAIILGTNEAEAGSNAGSNFSLASYTDAGSYIGAALSINRATLNVSLAGDLTVADGKRIYANGLITNGGVSIIGDENYQDIIQANTGTGSFNVKLQAVRQTSSGLRTLRGTAGSYYFDIRSDAIFFTNATYSQFQGQVEALGSLVARGYAYIKQQNNGTSLWSVHANDDGGTGYIGFVNPSNSWIFRVNSAGDATAYGNLLSLSDQRVKKDVRRIENADAIVAAMIGVFYTDTRTERASLGFIAQAIQAILPEAVHEDGNGLLSLNYGVLTAVLANAHNELRREVDELRSRLDRIEAR